MQYYTAREFKRSVLSFSSSEVSTGPLCDLTKGCERYTGWKVICYLLALIYAHCNVVMDCARFPVENISFTVWLHAINQSIRRRLCRLIDRLTTF